MSIPAKRVKDFDELAAAGVGAFFVTTDRKSLIAILPNTKGPSAINIGEDRSPRWILSGSEDKPSLTPSILISEWHGYLTNGEWITI